MSDTLKLKNRRALRVRSKIRVQRNERPRLSVFRSNNHIYAQVICDVKQETLASASTLDKEVVSQIKCGGNKDAATKVGALVAQRAKKAGVESVVFDRGSFLYHGRVQALAEGAREAGLQF